METQTQKKEKHQKHVGEKCINAAGTVSATASVLGSWQVCHNICIGLIALMSLIGITVVGMPLFFLTKIAVPLWSIAVVFLLITFGIYLKKRCISQKMLLLNSGLVIAGVPFASLQQFSILFWIMGGSLVFLSIGLFVKNKLKKNTQKQTSCADYQCEADKNE